MFFVFVTDFGFYFSVFPFFTFKFYFSILIFSFFTDFGSWFLLFLFVFTFDVFFDQFIFNNYSPK